MLKTAQSTGNARIVAGRDCMARCHGKWPPGLVFWLLAAAVECTLVDPNTNEYQEFEGPLDELPSWIDRFKNRSPLWDQIITSIKRILYYGYFHQNVGGYINGILGVYAWVTRLVLVSGMIISLIILYRNVVGTSQTGLTHHLCCIWVQILTLLSFACLILEGAYEVFLLLQLGVSGRVDHLWVMHDAKILVLVSVVLHMLATVPSPRDPTTTDINTKFKYCAATAVAYILVAQCLPYLVLLLSTMVTKISVITVIVGVLLAAELVFRVFLGCMVFTVVAITLSGKKRKL